MLEIDPNHINAAYARGACENKRGNFAKAIEDYNMALEKDQREAGISEWEPENKGQKHELYP